MAGPLRYNAYLPSRPHWALVPLLTIWATALPSAAEVVVAVAGPSSGYGAERAAVMADSARRAASRINEAGGIHGEVIRIDVADDGCSPTTSAALAASLALRKVALVLGHPCSGAAVAAAKVYGTAGVLFIATSTRHPRLTIGRSGGSIFRLSGRDDRQGEDAGRFLASRFGGSPVAIVHDGAGINRALAESATKALIASGAKKPILVRIATGRKDYAGAAAMIGPAAAVFYAGYPMEAGLLLQALRRGDSNAQFVVADAVRTEEFISTFEDIAPGVMALAATGASYPGHGDGELAEAALAIFAEAARRSNSLNSQTLSSVLQAQGFDTPIGHVAFDAAGDAIISNAAAQDKGERNGLKSGQELSGVLSASYGVLTWDGRLWSPTRIPPPAGPGGDAKAVSTAPR